MPHPVHDDPKDLVSDTEWHVEPVDRVQELLDTGPSGLDPGEAEARLERYGANRLRRTRAVPGWKILLEQFTSVVVLLLVAAALVSLAIGERVESLAIAAVLAINAAIGFVVELRARRAMDALLEYEAPSARVRRGGRTDVVDAERLVPGDRVELEEGDAVPADGRLVQLTGLRVDEAALTGESQPVEKSVEPVEEASTPVADRTSMVFSGTTVVGGRATYVVTATGSDTELGRIGALLAETEEGATPLEERLDALGRRLVWVTLGLAGLVSAVGIVRGAEVILMVETGVALAIAAVPEGLPAVATIALAVGLRRMAARNALVRRLAAVEALGSTTVVCTDKTGTLTAGQMTVKEVVLDGEEVEVTGEGFSDEGAFLRDGDEIDPSAHARLHRLLRTCALTSRADHSGDGEVAGDPTDAALLVVARKAGLERNELEGESPRIDEIPFDTAMRLSASIHRSEGGETRIHVKGAPRAILDRSARIATEDGDVALDDEVRERLVHRNRSLAEEGRRVIALAESDGTDPEELTFLGLVGILDPPAEGVEETIHRLSTAGLRTVVITGDQRATAAAIAERLGVTGERALDGRELSAMSDHELAEAAAGTAVYSRVSPKDKVRIVSALQGREEIVAMIGDGVNDAAALKKADVGVAMGGRGTDVARQAAAIVLSDDRFVTIGVAVEEGRVIFDNIKKFVFYLFSCNIAELATIMCASLVGAPVPLLPLQILWLNLVTDTFPALALALEPGEPGVMERAPRDPDETILSARFVRSMAFYASLITAVTLVAFVYGLRAGDTEFATTMTFMTLAFAQLFHLGNARSRFHVLKGSRIISNPWAVAAVPLVIALQLAAIYWPSLASLLGTVRLELADWAVVVGLALVPAVVGQGLRLVRRRGDGNEAAR